MRGPCPQPCCGPPHTACALCRAAAAADPVASSGPSTGNSSSVAAGAAPDIVAVNAPRGGTASASCPVGFYIAELLDVAFGNSAFNCAAPTSYRLVAAA